jgi:hypothetical protein
MTTIGKDDREQYHCYKCGNVWKEKRKWLYWPIRLGFQPRLLPDQKFTFAIKCWGWQVASDRPGVQVFGWTLRVWRLLIKFGSMDYKPEFRYDYKYAVWIKNR